MTDKTNEDAPLDSGDLTESVAAAVGDEVAEEVTEGTASAEERILTDTWEASNVVAGGEPVLSPYEAGVLSNIAAQLRELFGAAGITQENVEKFAGNVRDAVAKGAEKIKDDDTVEDAIEDIQEFFKKVNVKLNKFANDAVENWNKSIADD